MNKKLISLYISLFTLFFLSQCLIKSELILDTFFQTIHLWFYNLFPSIFLFFTITDILSNYNFSYYLSCFLGKIFQKIYHLPEISSYAFFMSTVSGFPGNSKLIKDLLDNGEITSMDASKLLTMTHFSNPLFIIYTIGINFLHDKKIGILILLVHFLTNFLVGFLFRNIFLDKNSHKPLSFHPSKPFMMMLKESFTNNFITLLNVLGILLFFAIISSIITYYLELNPFSDMLLKGFLEITNGLNALSLLSLDKIKAATIATFFISFGGISIHLQIMSILNNYHLNYFIYFIARLLHGTIASLIIFLILIYH